MENYSELLQKLIPGLVDIFGNRPIRIILYGSVARGTQTEESDIDIAVILPSYTREMHDQMIKFVVDLELEYNRVVSVHLIDSAKFAEWEDIMPFYQNVKKEGIELWPAA